MNVEHDLIAEIGLKTREQYMATWGLIYRQDAVVKRAESEYETAMRQNRIINWKRSKFWKRRGKSPLETR